MPTATEVLLKMSVGRDKVIVSRSFFEEVLSETAHIGGFKVLDGIKYMFGTRVEFKDAD
jgi:hypothetical protein